MAKKFRVNTVMALAFTAALFTSSNSLASAIYGFGSGPGITPKAHIDPLSAEQIKRIPASYL